MFQVFMIRPDLEGVSCAFEVVIPVFQCFYYSQEFPVVNIVISLCWRKRSREESDWVPVAIFSFL
ncbi:hypothetical protein HETIRDRAFT_324603 [Heterobasidion irregulare TC 32-1]|uniref:Uncharacterized protein n=1 Tax=Heterobasidion irregulare (strain TC 32-1) TaxID=747525 RepID=W4JZL6_HETIT|nr:uncharacterized protein HETIRDRAFT_324603 [Heterobasidion irregulare TC 32-1]ETW78914.1 hypothetical protein HETIRDRAFT_324603 [Heterobasidion irregulare TC 32-1]